MKITIKAKNENKGVNRYSVAIKEKDENGKEAIVTKIIEILPKSTVTLDEPVSSAVYDDKFTLAALKANHEVFIGDTFVETSEVDTEIEDKEEEKKELTARQIVTEIKKATDIGDLEKFGQYRDRYPSVKKAFDEKAKEL